MTARHIHGGRRKHYSRGDTWRTLCGRWWVATIVGPPADAWPDCSRCRAVLDASPNDGSGT